MKIKLKKITTEIPENAVRVEDLSGLKEGDFILKVWDNPKFPAGMEINSRLVAQVKRVDKKGKYITFGGWFHELGKRFNATYCSGGYLPFNSYQKNARYPVVIFKITDT